MMRKYSRILFLMLVLIGVTSHAMAFTLRFGPVSVADHTMSINRMSDADIPTPKMFNVTIGTELGITFGPPRAPDIPAMVPAFGLTRRTTSHTMETTLTPHDRHLASDRQLSGLEIMLLRDTEQIAAR